MSLILVACSGADDDWLYAQTPLPNNANPLIIAVGDSISAGWMDCRGEPPCEGIEYDWWQAVFADEERVNILSRGIGGSTTADLVATWERDTQDADIVIIMSGVNDLSQAVPPDQIMRNFQQMRQNALEANAVPIFTTIMPSDTTQGAAFDAMQAINAELRGLRSAGWYVIDLHEAMQDPEHSGYLRRDEIAHEGSAHPNLDGYGRLIETVRAWWSENGDDVLGDG